MHEFICEFDELLQVHEVIGGYANAGIPGVKIAFACVDKWIRKCKNVNARVHM